MNKIEYIKLVLILTTMLFGVMVNGQNLLGQLKIETSNQPQDQYWDFIKIIGKDTIVNSGHNTYKNRTIIDSIPQGQYLVQLHSIFYDIIEQPVTLGKRTTLKFDVDKYYKLDPDSILFLNRMANTDTLRIYYEQSGCFGGSIGYCYILKNGQSHSLSFKTESGFKTILLSDKEVDLLKKIETDARRHSEYVYGSTTSTRYTFELNRQILKYRISGESYFDMLIRQSK